MPCKYKLDSLVELFHNKNKYKYINLFLSTQSFDVNKSI